MIAGNDRVVIGSRGESARGERQENAAQDRTGDVSFHSGTQDHRLELNRISYWVTTRNESIVTRIP
jgi:hypothetical protein